jgi:S-adenosylmethionine:tRNA ribosyltransferase-isomerase
MTIDPNLRVADFDYELPPELIAQTPLPDRDRARLLVLNRATGTIEHSWIYELPRWLRPGDLLVANNSRVIPARLHAQKAQTGGKVEILLLQTSSDGTWSALARPARRLHPGDLLVLEPRNPAAPEARLEVITRREDGLVDVRFVDRADHRLEDYGETPLPPYIHTELSDAERYQTVYARIPGSAAAPTAGLHITERLRQAIRSAGIGWAEVTLHIGLDTFRPITAERVAEHRIHTEWCQVSEETAAQIAAARAHGGRVVAIGTTSARTLETLGQHWNQDDPRGFAGPTDIFITPGYQWRLVDALLTNFHLPRSTLLMMVSAFAGKDRILAAYEEAIKQRYRFYSFGDAMLIV